VCLLLKRLVVPQEEEGVKSANVYRWNNEVLLWLASTLQRVTAAEDSSDAVNTVNSVAATAAGQARCEQRRAW
jgi:hypothetical protein